jgi:hypothetical protein
MFAFMRPIDGGEHSLISEKMAGNFVRLEQSTMNKAAII